VLEAVIGARLLPVDGRGTTLGGAAWADAGAAAAGGDGAGRASAEGRVKSDRSAVMLTVAGQLNGASRLKAFGAPWCQNA
jgi:hypothetical protein